MKTLKDRMNLKLKWQTGEIEIKWKQKRKEEVGGWKVEGEVN